MSLKEFIKEKENRVNESNGIEIFFSDLDENKQKEIMEALKQELNVADDDEYSDKQIVKNLSSKPMFIVMPNDIIKELNIDI